MYCFCKDFHVCMRVPLREKIYQENSRITDILRNLWIVDVVLISENFLGYIDINCKSVFELESR